ncbi:hypothetical protein AO242_01410 [Pseudomonas sp. ICMP 561]|nr:hypothetical protein AO242_01410 [Pseudomonas sp. ICMP 561]
MRQIDRYRALHNLRMYLVLNCCNRDPGRSQLVGERADAVILALRLANKFAPTEECRVRLFR